MFSSTSRRDGFTLIESLVVICVIGIVAALVATAVQASREVSRRAQCINNLKNIGISINRFIESEREYPQGGNAYSAFARILPYIDQNVLYNSINMRVSADSADAINFTAYSAQINVFVCPSDGAIRRGFGPINYGGNVGMGFGEDGGALNGPFSSTHFGPSINPADILDGLSNTVAVSEFCRNEYPVQRHKKRTVFKSSWYNSNQFHKFIDYCRNIDPQKNSIHPTIKGYSWAMDGLGSSLYNHNLGPNNYSCSNGNDYMGAWTASSFHPYGVNTLFLDGHVIFVKENVSEQYWQVIGTMNGGEIQ